MNLEHVTVAVQQIRNMAHDPEMAHSAEDGLRDAVLEAIADGADNPAALAKAVLETNELSFPRWCA